VQLDRVQPLGPRGEPARPGRGDRAATQRRRAGAGGDHLAGGVDPQRELDGLGGAVDPARAARERRQPAVELDLVGEPGAAAGDQLADLAAGHRGRPGRRPERRRRDHDVDRRARIDLQAGHAVLVGLGLDAAIAGQPGATHGEPGAGEHAAVGGRDPQVQPVVEALDQAIAELGDRGCLDAVLAEQHAGRAHGAIAGRIDRRDPRGQRHPALQVVGDGRQREIEPPARRGLGAPRQLVVLPPGRRRPVPGDAPGDLERGRRDRRTRAVEHRAVDDRPVARAVERPVGGGVDPEPRQRERLHRERHLVDRARRVPRDLPRPGARRPVERKRPRDHAPVSRGRCLLEQHLAAGIGDHPAARPVVERRQVARAQRDGAKPHRVAGLVQRPIGDHVDPRRRVHRQRRADLAVAELGAVAGVQLVVAVGDVGERDARPPGPAGALPGRGIERPAERVAGQGQRDRADVGHRRAPVEVRPVVRLVGRVVRERAQRDRPRDPAAQIPRVELGGRAQLAVGARPHGDAVGEPGVLAAAGPGRQPHDPRQHRDRDPELLVHRAAPARTSVPASDA
jgi:hypothetical protein